MSDRRIGVIGLGNMGSRMTRRIVDAGEQVVGYDVVPGNVTAAGAEPAADVASLVADADVILLSLPDSVVVESVVYGTDGTGGLFEHAHSGQLVIDLSTAAPESTRRIHADLLAKGVHYLDAGISGGAAAAEKGALTLMVGGDAAALDSVRDVLAHLSTHVFHCGDSGSGHVTKLLNNFLNAVALSATAEVMVAGRKAGLDLKTLLDVLNLSSGVNFATQNRFPKMITGDYLKGGLTNTLMLKDVTLYTELLGQLGVPSLNAAGPVASFGLARALGYADEISNTVVDALGDIAGHVRIHDGRTP
jgi:3-hydroxyisobutyrate dehydrogenase